MTKSKIIRITLAVIMALTLCIAMVFVSSANAADASDVLPIETYNDENYYFGELGFSNGYSQVPHTGSYLLYGEADQDVLFTSDDDGTTYNVILHNWNGTAKDYFALINLQNGVTLNIIAYGNNVIEADNHSGIKFVGIVDGLPVKVNITVMENSSLTVKSRVIDTPCISPEIELNVAEGAESNYNLADGSWKYTNELVLTRGTPNHTTSYSKKDNETCKISCSSCTVMDFELEHYWEYRQLDETDENYTTQHELFCLNCTETLGYDNHDIRYTVKEQTHTVWCNECDYREAETAHTIVENGCTVCKTNYIASSSNGSDTVYYLTIDGLSSAIATQGGSFTLHADVVASFGKTANPSTNDTTIDLNGFVLDGFSFNVPLGIRLTITDSSTEKSGKLIHDPYSSTNITGELFINNITLDNASMATRATTALLKLENVIFIGEVRISTGDGGSVELRNIDSRDVLNINLRPANADNVNIYSGKFAELKVSNSYSEDVNVAMLLPEGYAFSGEGGLISGSNDNIKGVTDIVEHTEHTYDYYHSSPDEHWQGCRCGYYPESTERSAHTIDESNTCPTCKTEIVAMLVSDDVTRYFGTANAAFSFADTLPTSEIKLLRDTTQEKVNIYKDVTLDLNGHTLKQSQDRIYVYGKLTVNDTSEGQRGAFKALWNDNYAINVNEDAELIINGGEIIGILYSSYAGAKITVNGGKLSATECFRITSGTLTINGGRFECEECLIDYGWVYDATIIVNGGVFVNTKIFGYEAVPPVLAEVCGTVNGCNVVFLSETGTVLTLNELSNSYEGIIVAEHENSELKKNDTHHWYSCARCSHPDVQLLEHTGIYKSSTDNPTHHNLECKICEQVLGTEEHIGGAANCTTLAVCEKCSTGYGALDENNHTGGTATCISQASCVRCNKPYGALNPDNHMSAESKHVQSANAGDEHTLVHSCCNIPIESGKHTGGAATCTDKAICTVCKLPYGAELAHVYTNGCDTECNVCAAARAVGEHKYDNACDTTCNECGSTREITHAYGTDGKCTVCGAVDSISPPSDDEDGKDGLGAGAIVGIAVGSASALGGIVALAWFFLKKKVLKLRISK